MTELSEHDLRDLATCLNCSGAGYVPDFFGDYEVCPDCTLPPRDPFPVS